MTAVPVLDVGGSHVCAAWVDVESWSVVDDIAEAQLPAGGAADEIISAIAACVDRLGDLRDSPLAVAIPGPFDYASGVGRFTGVGKFESLDGVDVGRRLLETLASKPSAIAFLNDAAAFTLGEWANGAAAGHRRAVGITLGTGIGSAFVADGALVTDSAGVPPEGHVYLLRPGGVPLEDRVSTRAIVSAYGCGSRGVLDVVRAARAGDGRAAVVLDDAFFLLGAALAPCLTAFGADVLVVGGKIADAWTDIAPRIDRGLSQGAASVPLVRARRPRTAPLVGAAYHLTRTAAHSLATTSGGYDPRVTRAPSEAS